MKKVDIDDIIVKRSRTGSWAVYINYSVTYYYLMY